MKNKKNLSRRSFLQVVTGILVAGVPSFLGNIARAQTDSDPNDPSGGGRTGLTDSDANDNFGRGRGGGTDSDASGRGRGGSGTDADANIVFIDSYYNKLVEPCGIEPQTFWMQTRRSPS